MYIYIYIYLNHFDVCLKLTRHCKSTIFWKKIFKYKNKNKIVKIKFFILYKIKNALEMMIKLHRILEEVRVSVDCDASAF